MGVGGGAGGVGWVVSVGGHPPRRGGGVARAALDAGVWGGGGVHPHDATTLTAQALSELRELARRPRVVAIGETGLDYYRDLSPREEQRRAFEAQLTLAQELGLAVIVHDREAHAEVLALLEQAARRAPGRLRGVMHCFSGDPELARRAVALGLYVGIAGPVTYPRAARLAQVAREVPLERLLVETDCPYLPPQSRRGQRNEPAYVRAVAERVAELRGLSGEELGRVTSDNARALFQV